MLIRVLIFCLLFTLSCHIVFAQTDSAKSQNKHAIFVTPQIMPEYPGGEVALFKFLTDSLRYPMPSSPEKIKGTVYVQFLIDSSGQVKEPKVLKGISPIYDEEVLRVIKLLPKWKPAIMNGKVVEIEYVIPVTFE